MGSLKGPLSATGQAPFGTSGMLTEARILSYHNGDTAVSTGLEKICQQYPKHQPAKEDRDILWLKTNSECCFSPWSLMTAIIQINLPGYTIK